MNKITQNRLKGAFRKIWLWSIERKECLQRNKIKRGVYQCEMCLEGFKMKEVQIHHIKEVGSIDDVNAYCERLFCSPDKLKCLCKNCHNKIHNKK